VGNLTCWEEEPGDGMMGAGSSHAATGQWWSVTLLDEEGIEREGKGLGMDLEEMVEAITGTGRECCAGDGWRLIMRAKEPSLDE
jgi:hypothetical protein